MKNMKKITAFLAIVTLIITQSTSVWADQPKVQNGTHALDGLLIGGAVGGGVGVLTGLAFVKDFCPGSDCSGDNRDTADYFKGALIFGGLFGAIGGLAGLGIGALVPKYHRVEITPVVSRQTNGVNVGIKF
jgi:hypothetical protein